MKSLEANIKRWRKAYAEGTPEVDDFVYDEAIAELKAKKPGSRVLKEVGEKPKSKKHKHVHPCGSLNNTFDEEGIVFYLDKFRSEQFIVEPKLDGCSLTLTYHEGVLVMGATRGDGSEGEDVTDNCLRVRGVRKQLHLPINCEVRGEVVVYSDVFAEVFAPLGYANPRNSATGTLRKSNSELAKHLTFIAYEFLSLDGEDYDDEVYMIRDLAEQFNVPEYFICDRASVIQYWQDTGHSRSRHGYDIDGVVVKIRNRAKAKSLGTTSDLCPRSSIACKWKGCMIAETTVTGIELGVGFTGRINPTAILAPVSCGGVTISRASLKNWDEIDRLKGIGVGSVVKIERAGQVIPDIIEVVTGSDNPFKRPTHCPVCNTPTVADGPRQNCPNDDCPAQSFKRVLNWVKGRNILHLGESTLEKLMSPGPIKDIDDLYKLTEEDLIEVAGANASKILAEIDKSRTCTLAQLIGNIGIAGFGERDAAKLDHILFLEDNGFSFTNDAIVAAVGPSKAMTFIHGISHDRVECLIKLRQQLIVVKPQAKVASGWTGKSFCITGPTELVRDELKAKIEAGGGIWKSGVSAKLDYLIVADATSSKAKVATKLGVKTMTEAEALSWLSSLP